MKHLMLLIAIGALSACISVNRDPVDYYDFQSPQQVTKEFRVPIELEIPDHLANQRVLVKVSEVRYRYLNHAKWLDSLDKRIRHHLSQRVGGIVSQGLKIKVRIDAFDFTENDVALRAMVSIVGNKQSKQFAFNETRTSKSALLESQVKSASELLDALAEKISESLMESFH